MSTWLASFSFFNILCAFSTLPHILKTSVLNACELAQGEHAPSMRHPSAAGHPGVPGSYNVNSSGVISGVPQAPGVCALFPWDKSRGAWRGLGMYGSARVVKLLCSRRCECPSAPWCRRPVFHSVQEAVRMRAGSLWASVAVGDAWSGSPFPCPEAPGAARGRGSPGNQLVSQVGAWSCRRGPGCCQTCI